MYADLRHGSGFALTPPPTPTAGEITNWRAKAVLGLAGMLTAVDVTLDAMQEPNRTGALAAWTSSRHSFAGEQGQEDAAEAF